MAQNLPYFTDNTAKFRFEYHVRTADGAQDCAFAHYRREGNEIHITHVEAPTALRGTGAAGELMRHITHHARENALTLIPICSYAVAWLKKHPAP